MRALILVFAILALVLVACQSPPYDWSSDDISLMRHETEGTYGCFGCSSAGSNPALCVDPIIEMKFVEESAERYCDAEFNVVEK
jgi:hypothetical protein